MSHSNLLKSFKQLIKVVREEFVSEREQKVDPMERPRPCPFCGKLMMPDELKRLLKEVQND